MAEQLKGPRRESQKERADRLADELVKKEAELAAYAGGMTREDLEALSETLAAFDKGKELASSEDPLTGLMSRGAFMSRAGVILENLYAGREHQRRQHNGTVAEVCFIGVDIDHFKLVNDTYGHPVADGVLKKIAQTLAGVRAGDLVGRVGGEEITMLFLGPKEEALKKAEELRAAIQALRFEGMGDKEVTASFGVAEVGSDEKPTLEEMLKRADDALYAAKDAERNNVIEYGSPKFLEHARKSEESPK